MRTFSFIFAIAVFLVGPSMAGSFDAGLPAIGTFSYIGSPVSTNDAPVMVLAAR